MLLLCVAPEERPPVRVRIRHDAQYTVDLSSGAGPLACLLHAAAWEAQHALTCILWDRGWGDAVGRWGVREEEAPVWSAPWSLE